MKDKDDPADPHQRISSVKAITDAFAETSPDSSDELIRDIVRQRAGLHVTPGLINSIRAILKDNASAG